MNDEIVIIMIKNRVKTNLLIKNFLFKNFYIKKKKYYYYY